ncbi:thiamine pyrophosphate-binding protein [Baekduia soli]|uniref:thiamine pyrophosphate-binding protein n=1 Tax=Baekduia soli TaxID=496014 RepID=UPI001E3D177B|nr:thiamine pyrophosphate-dependent enzyme [Baekduia soli]
MIDRLCQWGVDTIFGLPGDGINGLMEALRARQDRVRYVHVRHEEVGAMAAVGYARFTGKLGVCFATAGPGAIHLANGLLDARMEGVPLLAITGMTYHDLIGTHYLQDFDTDHLYANLAAYNQRIMGPAHIENVVDLACRTALSQRLPSHIAFPIDYQVADASDQMRFKRNLQGHTSTAFTAPVRAPVHAELERAAQLLAGCSKIAILAGQGARGAGAELEQVAEKLGAPVAKASLGKDCIPDDSPYTTGGIGVIGTRPTTEAMDGCDGLLIVGSSMPYLEFYPSPGQAKCVQIDDKPERIGLRHPADVGLVGDARVTLRELLPLLTYNEHRGFLSAAQRGMKAWWKLMEHRASRADEPCLKPQTVAWHLAKVLADDAIVCGDSGQVTYWGTQMPLRRGQRFAFSGTNCSMAAALPYAIGAQTAYPERQVVAFTGDGSMTMQMGDLATLVQHELPVKVIVFKNNTLGLIKWEQMLFLGNPEYGVTFAPVDFVKVAEGCGATAFHIEDSVSCEDTLRRALGTPGPVLVECVVDPNEPRCRPRSPATTSRHWPPRWRTARSTAGASH